MEKNNYINKNKPPTTTNDTIASKEATTKDRPQDTISNSGGDDSILNYSDVIHDSIQQHSEQLSALLEKTKTLRLSQESVPSGFGNDSPLSDEELDITVISSSQSGKSFQKAIKNTPSETCAVSQIQEGSSSVTSDVTSLHRNKKAKKPEPMIAVSSAVPPKAYTSSRPALKRGRSTEEPHPEAKKASTAPASRPLPTTSTPSASKSVVTKPPPPAPSSSKPDKVHKEEVKSQTAGQTGRKRKYSQTIYPDNLRVAIIDKAKPE
uniref:Uncharacterized protein n=1 Tax=Musca domestica TaxID=7370 RepID=A0A1I8MEJ3_MUSDO